MKGSNINFSSHPQHYRTKDLGLLRVSGMAGQDASVRMCLIGLVFLGKMTLLFIEKTLY